MTARAGAVSVTGIKGDLPAWRVNELGQAVRQAADRVSEILGGPRYADQSPRGPAMTATTVTSQTRPIRRR